MSDPLGLRKPKGGEDEEVAELSATGLEAMMEAMEVVNAKTDKQSMGTKVGRSSVAQRRREGLAGRCQESGAGRLMV